MNPQSPSPETPEGVLKIIRREVLEEIPEVRNAYLARFAPEVEKFCSEITETFGAYRALDAASKDKETAYVSALAFSALNSALVSMRFLVSGYQVASGALFRQTLETVALAILCATPSLGIMARFINDTYSTQKAIRDLLRNANKLDLSPVGVQALGRSRAFFHQFSHPSRLSLATLTSLSGRGIYLGAAFDEAKLEAYRKEIEARVSVAKLLTNIFTGIREGRHADSAA